MVGTYDCLTEISNIMSVLIYDGGWQRPDGRAEIYVDQHSVSWKNGQPNSHTDDEKPKNCSKIWRRFIQTDRCANGARPGRPRMSTVRKRHETYCAATNCIVSVEQSDGQSGFKMNC